MATSVRSCGHEPGVGASCGRRQDAGHRDSVRVGNPHGARRAPDRIERIVTMKRIGLAIVSISATTALLAHAAPPPSRGVVVRVKESEQVGAAQQEVRLYSRSYALVIGNDTYSS